MVPALMSYRHRAKGRKARIEKRKRDAFEKAVQREVLKRPERVRIQYRGADAPIESIEPGGMRGDYVLTRLNKTPEHRVFRVHVCPDIGPLSIEALRRNPSAMMSAYPVQEFVPVEMQCILGRSIVRWWNWEPREDVWKRTIILNRTAHYAEMLRAGLKHFRSPDPEDEREHMARMRAFDPFTPFGIREIVEWCEMVLEDIETIQGRFDLVTNPNL